MRVRRGGRSPAQLGGLDLLDAVVQPAPRAWRTPGGAWPRCVELGDRAWPGQRTSVISGPRSNGLRSSALAPVLGVVVARLRRRGLGSRAAAAAAARAGPSARSPRTTTTVPRKTCDQRLPRRPRRWRPGRRSTPRRNQRGPSTPTNRAGAKTVRPSGPADGIRVRSSVPSDAVVLVGGAALGGDRLRRSRRGCRPRCPRLRGREGLQLHARSPRGRRWRPTTCWVACSTSRRSSMPGQPDDPEGTEVDAGRAGPRPR